MALLWPVVLSRDVKSQLLDRWTDPLWSIQKLFLHPSHHPGSASMAAGMAALGVGVVAMSAASAGRNGRSRWWCLLSGRMKFHHVIPVCMFKNCLGGSHVICTEYTYRNLPPFLRCVFYPSFEGRHDCPHWLIIVLNSAFILCVPNSGETILGRPWRRGRGLKVFMIFGTLSTWSWTINKCNDQPLMDCEIFESDGGSRQGHRAIGLCFGKVVCHKFYRTNIWEVHTSGLLVFVCEFLFATDLLATKRPEGKHRNMNQPWKWKWNLAKR